MASRVDIPLALSDDTRSVLGYSAKSGGQDQRRVNCYYEPTRGAHGVPTEISLSKRPGVTVNGSTYGAASQVQYLVAVDPGSTWTTLTPWLFVKDGTNVKAVNASTSTTILNDTNFYPRFWDWFNISGTINLVVQLQDSANPAAASNSQKVYYSTAIATFTQISDAVFTAIDHRGKLELVDSWGAIAGADGRIYNSNANTLATWTATDIITRTVSQDDVMGLVRSKSQLLMFGSETVERFFRDPSNTAGSVFSRITNSVDRVGMSQLAYGGTLGKTNYYATLGDLTFFVGSIAGPQNSGLIVYNGSSFQKVSTPYEDKILSTTTLYSINRFAFHGKACIAIQMTAPSATTQKMLLFFPEISEWFEWESTVFGPVNNGTHFAGATDTQKIYTFANANKWQDDTTNYTMTVQFRLPAKDDQRQSMSDCGIIGDTAASATNLGVSFCDDTNDPTPTFGTARNIDMSKARKRLHRCGSYFTRQVRLTHTDSGEVRLRSFYGHML